MTYSKAHQLFAHNNSLSALDKPQDYFGPNWETLLNFWKYLDKLTEEQWKQLDINYRSLQITNALDFLKAATEVVGSHNRAEVFESTERAHSDKTEARYLAARAAREILGMHLILERGLSLYYLPLFGDL